MAQSSPARELFLNFIGCTEESYQLPRFLSNALVARDLRHCEGFFVGCQWSKLFEPWTAGLLCFLYRLQ